LTFNRIGDDIADLDDSVLKNELHDVSEEFAFLDGKVAGVRAFHFNNFVGADPFDS
jgi:hypothetical protein